MNMAINELTPEETYLWQWARTWRHPQPTPNLPNLDWQNLVTVAVHNRMATLLNTVFEKTGQISQLPPAATQTLQKGCAKLDRNANHLEPALRSYLHFAAQAKQEVVVIKGLWVSEKIYNQKNMRPGGDIDLLLRQDDIPQSLQILETKMGYGRWWRPLLDDQYYARHHLHQQRCNHDRTIWIEPHWLLDHPYTRLTVDYEKMIERATPGYLLGEPIRELNPADLLLSLAIHLVKHAVYLPATYQRADLPRLILADGMLMYFLDVDQAVRHYGKALDWQLTVQLAHEGGVVGILGSVLHACVSCLQTPVPQWVLKALAPPAPDRVTTFVMLHLAEATIATYQGAALNRLWAFLLGFQESIVFRPIRLLDLAHYAFPGRDYLQRRYGKATAVTATIHLLRAVGQYVGVARDTVVFNIRRRREVRDLDRQGYKWPELPPNWI